MQQPLINIDLKNARIYNVVNFDIVKGEEFSLNAYPVDEPIETVYDWFVNNDPILDVKVTNNTAEMKAVEEGISTILLMRKSDRQIMKTLIITVVPAIVPMATKLEIVAEDAVLK